MPATFRIEYDNPDLDSHTMDAYVFGHSLMALSTLCREADRVLNGKKSTGVTLEINATSEGSFDVLL